MENISTEELSVIYEKMGQHLFNLRNWYKVMMRAFNENNGTVSIETIVGIKHKASVAQAMEVWKSECDNLSGIRQELSKLLESQNQADNDMKEELACDKLRDIAQWLNWQDEHFNSKFKSISDLEKMYDACQKHSLEFADNLDWEDTEDEEYLLAKEVNDILGYEYYNV